MIFIGHLDLMRYFQKAMRRSGVDISYTAGFSPHQIMSFAQPLGVGIYSTGEYMDIQVDSEPDTEKIKNALNSVMSEGIDILSVNALDEKAENSMASVAAAEYNVYFRQGHCPDFDIEKVLAAFMSQGSINILKETKKGSRELDLKEHIFDIGYKPFGTDNSPGDGADDICINAADFHAGFVHMLLDASSGGNIKPSLVMKELYSFAGKDLADFDIIVLRRDMYADKGSNGKHEWVFLGGI